MKIKVDTKTNTVEIETEERPGYCQNCWKFLGRISFFKGDTSTESTLTAIQPLCYECLQQKIGNVPCPKDFKP